MELFADLSRLGICTALKDGIIGTMICKALPLQVNLLPAAKLCISAMLNSTACPSAGPKTPFLLYNNILLSKYKLSVPLTYQRLSSENGTNLPFETRDVAELGYMAKMSPTDTQLLSLELTNANRTRSC